MFFLRLGDLTCIHFKPISFSANIFNFKYLTVFCVRLKNSVTIQEELENICPVDCHTLRLVHFLMNCLFWAPTLESA